MPNEITRTIDGVEMLAGAYFHQPCRTWRYKLWRIWDGRDSDMVVFIGLNPSTADESTNDPTIRRCMGFARDWGYGGMIMLNAFAYRSTDPKGLRKVPDPIGPGNDEAILSCTSRNNHHVKLVVPCWGSHGSLHGRGQCLLARLSSRGVEMKVFGWTKGGEPKHPLYLKKTAELITVERLWT